MKARGYHNFMQRRAKSRTPPPPPRTHHPKRCRRGHPATPKWDQARMKAHRRWLKKSSPKARSERETREFIELCERIGRQLDAPMNRAMRRVARGADILYQVDAAYGRGRRSNMPLLFDTTAHTNTDTVSATLQPLVLYVTV